MVLCKLDRQEDHYESYASTNRASSVLRTNESQSIQPLQWSRFYSTFFGTLQ